MEISERKRKILCAIIDDYISTAVPVGSRAIAERFGMKISSATIRSEMNELETMGYLSQIHTSSGRIPSERAYRMYVDSLMKMAVLSKTEIDYICRYFDRRLNETETVLKMAAKAISEMTDYVSLVTAPQVKTIYIKHIQLIPISSRSALAVIITKQGIIKDMPITLDAPMTADQLHDISKVLNRIYSGRTLTERDLDANLQIAEEVAGQRLLFGQLISALKEHMVRGEDNVITVGGPKLLNHPEYNDVNKARTVLEFLESKEAISQLIDSGMNLELNIRIGNENEIREISDCSVITATYHIDDEVIGTIGVIGPVRMQYGKVLSVLDYMRKSLPKALTSANPALMDDNDE